MTVVYSTPNCCALLNGRRRTEYQAITHLQQHLSAPEWTYVTQYPIRSPKVRIASDRKLYKYGYSDQV